MIAHALQLLIAVLACLDRGFPIVVLFDALLHAFSRSHIAAALESEFSFLLSVESISAPPKKRLFGDGRP